MPFAVWKDGRAIPGATYSTPQQCAAEILVRGWHDPVERFGVCWQKGVEIVETKESDRAPLPASS